MQQPTILNRFAFYTPLIGVLSFFALFYYSSTLYPGGSQTELNSIRYDWMNNYWCNLMNEYAMNEQINPARPYAIFAMVVLCASIAVFFVRFAIIVPQQRFWKMTIKWCGVLSMVFAALMFTQYHDLMTSLSSIFGLFVVIGIIWEVYKSGMTFYKISGLICILLLAVNNYIYYSQYLIEYLPLIQKFTFAIVLAWIVGLNSSINEQKMNA